MKQELLYARVNLNGVPQGKKIQLSDYKLWYKEKKKRITVHELDSSSPKKFSFMELKLSEQHQQSWYRIMWDIDTFKLDELSRKPYKIPDRKLFYSYMQKSYQESLYDFLSQSTLNLIEEFRGSEDSKFNSWVEDREKGEKYYTMNKGVIRVGKNFIDTNQGRFIKSKAGTTRLKGGIILDPSNQLWIKQLLNSVSTITRDDEHKKTLIVCGHNMVYHWSEIVTDTFEKPITVSNKRDLGNITYGDLEEAKFVVVSANFLSHKTYSSCWDDYSVCENSKLSSIFTIMTDELKQDPNFGQQKNPVFSLVDWDRLVVDCDGVKRMINDNSFKELMGTLKAPIRWLHIKEISILKSDISSYFDYLANDKEVHFPLYDENGKVKPLDKISWKVTQKNHIQKCIEQAESQQFETDITRYFLVQNSYSPLKVETVINGLIRNTYPKEKLASILEAPVESLDVRDPCGVCHEEYNISNAIFMKCGHSFCNECAIRCSYIQGRCPICRANAHFDGLYKLDTTEEKAVVGSRYQKMMELHCTSEGKQVIVVQDKDMLAYAEEVLSSNGVDPVNCSGSFASKTKKIRDFNSNQSSGPLLLRLMDIDLLKSTRAFSSVIFVDMIGDVNSVMSMSHEDPVKYHFIVRRD